MARLKEYQFQDIFLTSEAGSPIMAKGLQGPGVDPAPRPVKPLPPCVRGDALDLWANVMRKWASENFRNEFSLTYDDTRYRCSRLSGGETIPSGPVTDSSLQGEVVTWCLRRIEQDARRLEDLKLPPWLCSEMRRLGQAHGLLLIAGTFASGKTTTASAVMKDWVNYFGGIGICLEDPPEVALAGDYPYGKIIQIEVSEDNFAKNVHRAKRQSADYFYLGEVRSPAAAYQLVHLSTIGPMAVSTIHGATPVDALIALTSYIKTEVGDYDLARQLVANSVKGVLHQSIANGRPQPTYLSVTGDDGFVIRSKILQGKFSHIHEDVEQQRRRREASATGGAVRPAPR